MLNRLLRWFSNKPSSPASLDDLRTQLDRNAQRELRKVDQQRLKGGARSGNTHDALDQHAPLN